MRSLSRSRVSGCNEGGVSDAVAWWEKWNRVVESLLFGVHSEAWHRDAGMLPLNFCNCTSAELLL
ncbi:unnamed protein product [Rhodiola kirilowii]